MATRVVRARRKTRTLAVLRLKEFALLITSTAVLRDTNAMCLKDSTSHPLVLLLDRPAKPLVLVNFCTDDKDIWCRTNQTCCKMGNDKFSCCPSPNGVCCKDGAACCPDNYTCEKGMCRGPKYLVPFIDTILTQRDRVRAGVL